MAGHFYSCLGTCITRRNSNASTEHIPYTQIHAHNIYYVKSYIWHKHPSIQMILKLTEAASLLSLNTTTSVCYLLQTHTSHSYFRLLTNSIQAKKPRLIYAEYPTMAVKVLSALSLLRNSTVQNSHSLPMDPFTITPIGRQ